MKSVLLGSIGLMLYVSFFLLPTAVFSQSDPTESAPPPIEQPMVRQGELAVKLSEALAVGTFQDEIEAESALGNVGITPRNGWIADYPVTPDIIGELQKSVKNAATSGKLLMGGKEALKALDEMCAELEIAVRPADGATGKAGQPSRPKNYPDSTVINYYYTTTGPPIVTYYEPPPDYYYLYSWVPYPFWWFGFWYPGYFILNDFHRVVYVQGRVGFVSNHFRDSRYHRVYRVDPVSRYRGRTYTGIGVDRTRGSISTGVPQGGRTIFNSQRYRMSPGGRGVAPFRGGQNRQGGEGRGRR